MSEGRYLSPDDTGFPSLQAVKAFCDKRCIPQPYPADLVEAKDVSTAQFLDNSDPDWNLGIFWKRVQLTSITFCVQHAQGFFLIAMFWKQGSIRLGFVLLQDRPFSALADGKLFQHLALRGL